MASRFNDSFDLEIRKLDYIHKKKLGEYLDGNNNWKKLMDHIPLDLHPVRSSAKRFTYEDICIIDRAIQNSGSKFTSQTELLLDEWGTMGKIRPTVGDLLILCQEIDALNAASYISQSILQGDPIVSNSAPSEILDEDFPDYDNFLEEDLTSAIEISEIGSNPNLPEHTLKTHSFKYAYLFAISNGFSDDRLLGRGGFSKVYLGYTRTSHMKIAIKKLNPNNADPECIERQLNYEIDQLPRLRHPNIIELLGYSNDIADNACLIYPYMENGTLEKKLHVKSEIEALSDRQRMVIAEGIASGLEHLHLQQKPLIHRDVKTSNILLDENLSPKLADFGLLRFGVTGEGFTSTLTQDVKGTPVYMPPEAITGDVSTKWDVWSYGVVLLEILSGLPVLDRTREDHDLLSHVQNISEESNFSIVDLMDPKAGWNQSHARLLLELSGLCRLSNKRNRPNMTDLLAKIRSVAS